MMKRICIAVCTVVLLLLAVGTAGAKTFISGDYWYTLLKDGTAQIKFYTGKAEKLIIPDTLYGVKVTTIGNIAMTGCNSLTVVTIPDSVSAMGQNPFARCEKLTKIVVSPRHPYLTVIDGVLFSKPDKRLICYPYAFTASAYSIPQGTAVIGDCAFFECSSLTEVTIPDSVTTIGVLAFTGCSSLKKVTIPDSVTTIGDSNFSGCSSLTEVTIPDSVTTIGDSAFSGCSSLTEVTIPDSVTTIGALAFTGCSSLKKVTIPDSVTSIGNLAFGWCRSLTVTVTPDSYAEQYCIKHNLPYTFLDALDGLNN